MYIIHRNTYVHTHIHACIYAYMHACIHKNNLYKRDICLRIHTVTKQVSWRSCGPGNSDAIARDDLPVPGGMNKS